LPRNVSEADRAERRLTDLHPGPEHLARMSEERAPGLGAQFGRTRAAILALVRAHLDLLRAELDEILGQVKVIASLAGAALFLALSTSILLYVGGFLFLVEWLFGSIGWGLAQGVLLGIAGITILVMAILGAGRRAAWGSLLLAGLATIGLALLCGSNVAGDAAASFARQLASPLDSPGLVALAAGAPVGAVVFALLLARVGGRGGLVGGLLLGAFLGMPVGWLIAGAPWTWPPAFGFAIVIGLTAWPILDVVIAWPRLDIEARFKQLYPQQSIDAANETRAWLEEQWQSRRANLRGR
jgi:hypothetical protein